LVTQKSKQRVVYVVNLGWYCWWDQDVSFERQWFDLSKESLERVRFVVKMEKSHHDNRKKKKKVLLFWFVT